MAGWNDEMMFFGYAVTGGALALEQYLLSVGTPCKTRNISQPPAIPGW
jgi:hypothetical protein